MGPYFAEKKAEDRHPQAKRVLTVWASLRWANVLQEVSMRRIVLLTLLALALPTAAWASSFSFSVVDTGPFVRGTMSTRTASGGFVTLSIDLLGGTGRLKLVGGALSPAGACNPPLNGSGMCTFSGATLDIENANGAVLDAITGVSGSMNKMPGGVVIRGSFGSQSGAPSGGNVSFTASFNSTSPFSGMLLGGRGIALAPEPGTLEGLLLGIGVLGLAGVTSRKLKLGT